MTVPLSPGLILGSERFVASLRRRLSKRQDDPDVPLLRRLRLRPPLDRIIQAVAAHYTLDPSEWRPGRRCDGIARALAAYLARVCFGYPATAVAHALGYARPSSVAQAVRRVQYQHARLAPALKALEAALTND